MTVPASIDPARLLSEHLERAEPDLLRAMLKTFIDTLMGAEADAVCGAPYGGRSEERINVRNGYRPREWDTRAGTIELAIPRLRSGSYFPDWLLERRKRAERALTTVVATCYLLGFFRTLAARGLSGVQLVTSDAHTGLVAAIGATLPGAAAARPAQEPHPPHDQRQ